MKNPEVWGRERDDGDGFPVQSRDEKRNKKRYNSKSAPVWLRHVLPPDNKGISAL
jgi:hypothetical protein